MKSDAIQKTCRRYRALFSPQGKVLIPIKFASEEDFFDRRDCLGVTLCPTISSYLDNCLDTLRPSGSVSVVFYGPALSRTKCEAVCNLVKTHYALSAQSLLRQIVFGLLQAGAALTAGLFCLAFPFLPAGIRAQSAAVLVAAAFFIALLRVGTQVPKYARAKLLFSAPISFHASL